MTREPTDATTLTIRGVELPKLGYGTWQLEGEDAYDGVLDALALGYRHFDTARAYGNEAQIGRALADTDVPREEIWLTTKVWRDDAAPDDLRRSVEDQLADLGVERIDLLLLHWPSEPPMADTLGAMTALRESGAVREIGVSNFPSMLLGEAIELAPIFCDQVEVPPLPAAGPGDARLPRARRAAHRLLALRARPRARRPRLGRDRRGARSLGRPGRAALAAGPAGRGRDPEGLEPRAAGGEPRRLRLRPQRRRARPHRRAVRATPADREPVLRAELGLRARRRSGGHAGAPAIGCAPPR